jgi:cytochrome c oxidase cbb3-type subunit III
MYFIQSIKKKILPVAASMLIACSTFAQGTSQAAASQAEEKNNLLAILLIVTAIVLAFVIWGMGQALIAISRQVMLKNKNAAKALSILLLVSFSLLSQLSFAQTAVNAVTETATAAPNYGGLSANNFWAFVGVISIEVAAILFLAFSIKRIYQELLPEEVAATKLATQNKWWSSLDKKFFTRAVAVEQEADIVLDHDYDGIKELDNALPPWWKYGFIVTIAIAFIYLGYFHAFGSGKNPTEEYAAEMQQAKIEKEFFNANNKDKIDENNVPMADAAGIKAGQIIFETNCVACHLKDGGGNVGPNLTDDYWLHKGSLNDIYKTIKTGYPDKGMQAWEKQFSPKEISEIASYVKSMRGTKPAAPKAPQGDLYTESAGTDSTAATVKTDTVAVAKSVK